LEEKKGPKGEAEQVMTSAHWKGAAFALDSCGSASLPASQPARADQLTQIDGQTLGRAKTNSSSDRWARLSILSDSLPLCFQFTFCSTSAKLKLETTRQTDAACALAANRALVPLDRQPFSSQEI